MAKLHIKDAKGSRELKLTKKSYSIGRDPGNAIPIPDEGRASRNHCTLEKTFEGWVVTDNKSSNGTTVGGKKISTQVLADGMAFVIGTTAFTFDEEAIGDEMLGLAPAKGSKGNAKKPAGLMFADEGAGGAGAVTMVDVGWRLVWHAGPKKGSLIYVDERFTIGRQKGNDLVLENELKCSKKHCELR
jgi:pSer/pThr/pTyr-binding forkhead associated (FHA) protein